ncbi:MAG: hypothetical protein SFU91_11690 [Chloroherpetonaceae bacterium]|nr:hypothetical protein [Chloroherpetonaceae bacterium]
MKIQIQKSLFVFAFLSFSSLLYAQSLRDIQRDKVTDAGSTMFKPGESFFGNLLGSAFDENHFRMNHSYALQFNSFTGATTGEYTNTMVYRFNFPLMIRADVSMMHQPLGVSQLQRDRGFGGMNFNGIYLRNLSAIYQPTKDLGFGVSFSQVPQGALWQNGGWFGNGGFMPMNPFFQSNSNWWNRSNQPIQTAPQNDTFQDE